MPSAACLFRSRLAYRRDEFLTGLKRVGFEVTLQPEKQPSPEDVLVIWNRYGWSDTMARRYEQVGARVIVAENGYIGRAPDGGKFYALALHHHNGAGSWPVGGPERWASFNIDLAPWRPPGEHLLILPQRGIGERGVAMPSMWPTKARALLKRLTRREARIRPHPGMAKTEPYDELRGAHAALTWASGAAIKALAAGFPVFHQLPRWVGASASVLLNERTDIEAPFLGDRLPMFARLAWAQWRMDEIVSGEAFAWLLGQPDGQDQRRHLAAAPPPAL